MKQRQIDNTDSAGPRSIIHIKGAGVDASSGS
jgi:hypothetical protein